MVRAVSGFFLEVNFPAFLLCPQATYCLWALERPPLSVNGVFYLDNTVQLGVLEASPSLPQNATIIGKPLARSWVDKYIYIFFFVLSSVSGVFCAFPSVFSRKIHVYDFLFETPVHGQARGARDGRMMHCIIEPIDATEPTPAVARAPTSNLFNMSRVQRTRVIQPCKTRFSCRWLW